MPRTIIVAIVLSCGASVARAQTMLENGQMRLELIGLKRWTVPMIQDSLHRYAPQDSLMTHACAGILRAKLKFADASVTYTDTDSLSVTTKPYLAVTVVEPQDSALIRYRGAFRKALPTRAEWAPVLRVFEKDNHAFQAALQWPGFLDDRPMRADPDAVLRPALPLRRFLRAHTTASDRQMALTTLRHDGNRRNRIAAVVLLSNFARDDSTWWALADALRDPETVVRATASQVISSLAYATSRPVDWAPAAPTLRAILDGTNLFAHNQMMDVLAATRVDRALARPLLGGGGFLVLAKLSAQGQIERRSAHRFLVQIAGRDLGTDPAPWRQWVRGL